MSHKTTTSSADESSAQIILGVDPGLADAEVIQAEIVTGPAGGKYLRVLTDLAQS